MTSTDSTQQRDGDDVTVTGPPQVGYTQEDLVLAQLRARRLSAASYLVLALVIGMAVAAAGWSAYQSSQTASEAATASADNGQRVDDLIAEAVLLRDQVATLQAQIDDRRDTTDLIEQCEAVLAAGVRDTTRDYNAAEGDLIVTLRPLAAGQAGQDELIDAAIGRLDTALTAYRQATILSSTWNVLDRQVKESTPCPVPLP